MSKAISPEEYRLFSDFLEDACGIVLGENKHYLVTSRLQRLMDELNIPSLSELVKRMGSAGGKSLQVRIIDAMTTNETLWFRDSHPFDILRNDIFPELSRERSRPLKIWSAACSSGQEPYTMSMVAQEYGMANPGKLARGVEILATDISKTVLEQARAATYDNMSLARGMSEERKLRYFRDLGNRQWELRKEIRERVRFTELNLMQSYLSLGKFDIIFCRNVLIYFSADLKRDIIGRLARALNPRGYLFLGSSESLAGHSDMFDMIRSGGAVYYRLKG
ncbi:protein-glutamate O-methyltransferase CheR [Sulfuriflexus sp.]|uniref:CheR family methyltransferase n=1 Tax=Sulfuriflexus sp. TaxID=2015443 RepID=UPI0028CC499F|nr:protein-glutamate O-methyltransferase CheR [Sulfuriflexus sp.]MDT8404493.1 protein-glutamate O-methyltransferase CheR [Sulfuriflexus sp.]